MLPIVNLVHNPFLKKPRAWTFDLPQAIRRLRYLASIPKGGICKISIISYLTVSPTLPQKKSLDFCKLMVCHKNWICKRIIFLRFKALETNAFPERRVTSTKRSCDKVGQYLLILDPKRTFLLIAFSIILAKTSETNRNK